MAEQDEVWTVVRKGKSGKRNQNGQRDDAATFVDHEAKDATLETTSKAFAVSLKTWQASICRRSVFEILRRTQPSHGWRVSCAVCLAIGSFSRENLECRRRSMRQLVVFIDITQQLASHSKEPTEMKLYAQEPRFTELDHTFLKSLGIEVLDSSISSTSYPGFGPAGDLLNPGTFFYEPFMDMNDAMRNSIAASDIDLYIGSSLHKALATEGSKSITALTSERMYRWPLFDEDPNALEGLIICWPDREDDRDEDG